MLSTKEKMFLDYMLVMFNEQEKSSLAFIPHTVFSLGKDLQGRVFFLEDTGVDGHLILNPVQWLIKVCEAIGHGVAGMPKIVNITEEEPLKVKQVDSGNAYHSIDEKDEILDILSKFNGDKFDAKFDEGFEGILSTLEIHIEGIDGHTHKTSKLLFVENLKEYIEDYDNEEDWEDEDFEEEEKEKIVDGFKKTLDNHTIGTITGINGLSGSGVSGLNEDAGEILKKMLADEDLQESELSNHEQIAFDIAGLVDEKQKAYGDSVGKSERIIAILMEDYDNGDGTYTIPQALIPHLLYQIRIIDKQNRVFSNPEHDLMDESPYQDILGYALLMLAKQQKEKQ